MMQLELTIACPQCGHQSLESMPIDACQFFYDCKGCGARLKPSRAIVAYFALTVRSGARRFKRALRVARDAMPTRSSGTFNTFQLANAGIHAKKCQFAFQVRVRPLKCGRSSMAERQLPKLHTRVRFPSPAPACLCNRFNGLSRDRRGNRHPRGWRRCCRRQGLAWGPVIRRRVPAVARSTHQRSRMHPASAPREQSTATEGAPCT